MEGFETIEKGLEPETEGEKLASTLFSTEGRVPKEELGEHWMDILVIGEKRSRVDLRLGISGELSLRGTRSDLWYCV